MHGLDGAAERNACYIDELVAGQPFCSGVIVWQDDRMVFTVGKAKDWTQESCESSVVAPISWVGGGQELGESPMQCAAREGIEEIGGDLVLYDSSETFWFQDGKPVTGARLRDLCRPSVVLLYASSGEPYKTGLPAGPFVWVALYQATANKPLQPVDVPGLLLVTLTDLPMLMAGISVAQCHKMGIPIMLKDELADDLVLRLRRGGPEQTMIDLWQQGRLNLDPLSTSHGSYTASTQVLRARL